MITLYNPVNKWTILLNEDGLAIREQWYIPESEWNKNKYASKIVAIKTLEKHGFKIIEVKYGY